VERPVIGKEMMLRYPTTLPPTLSYIDGSFNVRKLCTTSTHEAWTFMGRLLRYLKAHPDPMIVPILDFQEGGYANGAYRYQYDMVGMGMLSSTEKRIIETTRVEWHIYKRLPSQSYTEIAMFGRREYPQLMQFLEQVCQQDRYGDLHEGNVMVDHDYSYRLVDVEGFLHYPLNHPRHDWITS
jgi:hypothetical protein